MVQNLETPIHNAEKKTVLKAINQLGLKVSAASVAEKTGLPLLKVGVNLNRIASETGGHLLVDDRGQLTYAFNPGFEMAYILNRSNGFFKKAWRVFFNALSVIAQFLVLASYFLLRISFGIVLILSVVIIVVLAVVLILRLLGGGDSEGGEGFSMPDLFESGSFFRYWAVDWLWDWFFWLNYIRWDQSAGSSRSRGKEDSSENFLDSVFSFLFGDGDPNPHIEERYWQSMAAAIKAHKGVMVAEQVAPYAMDIKYAGNEDWMLPILVRFDGLPEVTEQGNIVYTFSAFVGQNAGGSEGGLYSSGAWFKENLEEFSRTSMSVRSIIALMAVFVIGGSLYLMHMASTVALLLPFVPVLGFIFLYGTIFFVIPVLRYIFLSRRNRQRMERNLRREGAAERLRNPDQSLQGKIRDGHTQRTALQQRSPGQMIYRTDKDLLDQEFEP